jgi:hypothetical protein
VDRIVHSCDRVTARVQGVGDIHHPTIPESLNTVIPVVLYRHDNPTIIFHIHISETKLLLNHNNSVKKKREKIACSYGLKGFGSIINNEL